MEELPELLQRQAELLQNMSLDGDHAAQLAKVVERLNTAVAEAIEDQPYDVDATTFYAQLSRFKDPGPDE